MNSSILPSIISALAGLLGSLIGGTIVLVTAYFTHKKQRDILDV